MPLSSQGRDAHSKSITYSAAGLWPTVHYKFSKRRCVYSANDSCRYQDRTNISESGMRVFVPRDLEMGRWLTVELNLPYNREELKVRAAVRNRVGFEYGIEFLEISEEEREAIRKNCRVLNLLR